MYLNMLLLYNYKLAEINMAPCCCNFTIHINTSVVFKGASAKVRKLKENCNTAIACIYSCEKLLVDTQCAVSGRTINYIGP